MDRELRKHFSNLLVYSSLNTKQLNYLGEKVESTFNIYTESGFGTTIPLPPQSAVETIVNYFVEESIVVELFTILLHSEGERFYDSKLILHNANTFIKFLAKRKWIYDFEMKRFFRDPFFENEINFLKSIKVIDLRNQESLSDLMANVTEVTKTLGDKDLEWSINLRLYDLDRENSQLIREIIKLLLVRQNIQAITFDIFTCLKELAINASKANYKLLYEKLVTAPQGISATNNYELFLEKFLEEIENDGNKNLLELAKKKNRFINITFQSTNSGIGVWVTNSQNITTIEKAAILKKLGYTRGEDLFAYAEDSEYKEGAGLGIGLVLSLLHLYTEEEIPLKVVFYPNFIKMGFFLSRTDIIKGIEKKNGLIEK